MMLWFVTLPPGCLTPPPLYFAILSQMVPPFIVKMPILYTPPPTSVPLPPLFLQIVPPFMIKVVSPIPPIQTPILLSLISTPSFITVVPTVINPYSLQFCRVTPAFRTHVLYAVIARSITLFPSIVRFPKVTFSYVLNTE